MSNANSHLTAEAIAALDLPLAVRAARMLTDRFVTHERLQHIFDIVDYMVSRPAKVRADGLIISANPGCGKTMLCEAILRRYPPELATATTPACRPVIVISMSEAREAKQLYIELLKALGCPHPYRYTADRRRDLVLELAKAASLRLLVIDEIQDVLIGTLRQQQLALEAIKALMNRLRVAVIALGTQDAVHAMSANVHLRARFADETLPLWKADVYLAHFLEAYEATLPLRERSRLSSLDTMRQLVKLSDGVLATMVERLGRAAALAIEHGEERITRAWIERALWEVPHCLRTETGSAS